MIIKYNEHNHDGNDNYHLSLGSNKLNPTGWRYRSMAYSSQKLMELQAFFLDIQVTHSSKQVRKLTVDAFLFCFLFTVLGLSQLWEV